MKEAIRILVYNVFLFYMFPDKHRWAKNAWQIIQTNEDFYLIRPNLLLWIDRSSIKERIVAWLENENNDGGSVICGCFVAE